MTAIIVHGQPSPPKWSNYLMIPVQVNGKMAARISIPNGSSNLDVAAAALADPAVIHRLDGREPRKIVVVPNRIVNVVA